MPFDPPPNLTNADEYRHSKPKGAEDLLYGDTLWVSVVDPAAGIHGVIHSHLTNNGYARFESLFVIDGEETGEVGTGTSEYSIMPVFPRWKV